MSVVDYNNGLIMGIALNAKLFNAGPGGSADVIITEMISDENELRVRYNNSSTWVTFIYTELETGVITFECVNSGYIIILTPLAPGESIYSQVEVP